MPSAPKIHPCTRLAANLMWTRHGTVYAMWRLQGMRYGGSRADKKRVASVHSALVRSLGSEAMLVSVIMPENPATIVERMIEGVDLDECPLWIEEAEHTLDRFDSVPIGQRFYWLCVPLANRGMKRVQEPLRALGHDLRVALDLPPAMLEHGEIEQRMLQMRKIEELIPAPFRPMRVGGAEHVWLWNHFARRGQVDVPVPSSDESQTSGELLGGDSGASFTPHHLDEGAQGDQASAGRFDLLNQRVLKVTDVGGVDLGLAPSYQALMAVADTPPGGIRFPGSEWLQKLDTYGIDVDWVQIIRVNAREKVLAKNRSAVRKLNEQYSQQEVGEASSTGPHELNLAASKMRLYDKVFADDRQEVEVEHTVVLAVSGTAELVESGLDDDGEPLVRQEHGHEVADRVMQQANLLAKALYNDLEIRLERLPGKMEELWWSMIPGTPRSNIVNAYAQITSSRKWGLMVPLTSRRLGGHRGPVPFMLEETSRPQAVHLDPAGYPELDMSGAVLACAELGAGKSVFLKTLCSHLVSDGGRFYAIDGSPDGEWTKFATSFAEHAVVSVLDPGYSMDPIRLLGTDGASMAQTFLTMLLGITDKNERSALGAVCSPDYLTSHDLTSIAAVSRYVQEGHLEHPGGPALASSFAAWDSSPLARVIFDEDLPAAPLDCAATVWWTKGIQLPSKEDIKHPHLFHEMPPEKIMGRAYYRLLTALGRHVCFADPATATAVVTDELHRMANPENLGDLEQFLREGRRSKALLWAGTHDVADVSVSVSDKDQEETLASLIPTRMVMRMGSRPMAKRAVAWLGEEEGTPEFEARVKTVLEDLSPKDESGHVPDHRKGEGFLRDGFGESGRGRVLLPATPSRAAAVLTTPPKKVS